MAENKRYEVAIYDDKAINGYCVLDKDQPCPTCRLKYHNVFISTKEGCEIVTDLLNELNDEVVKGDLFKLTVAMAIQHRINWLKKQIWDNTDRIDELQSLKKELKL